MVGIYQSDKIQCKSIPKKLIDKVSYTKYDNIQNIREISLKAREFV